MSEFFFAYFPSESLGLLRYIQRIKVNLPDDLHIFDPGNIYWWMPLDRKLPIFGQGNPYL